MKKFYVLFLALFMAHGLHGAESAHTSAARRPKPRILTTEERIECGLRNNDFPEIRRLLERDDATRQQVLNFKIKTSETNLHGVSALHYAIYYGYDEIATKLIEAGADLTEVNPYTNGTLFHEIARSIYQIKNAKSKHTQDEYYRKMGLLVKMIATKNVLNINQVNKQGYTPFQTAYRSSLRCPVLLLEAFIECGATISEKEYDEYKQYALHAHEYKDSDHKFSSGRANDWNYLMRIIEDQPGHEQYRKNFFKTHPELKTKEPKEVTAPCSNPTVDLETPYSQTSQNANLNQKSTSSTLLKIGGVTASSIGLVTSLVVANKKHADFCKKKPTKKDEKADKAQENFDAPKKKKLSSTENIKRYFTTVYQTPSNYKADIASHVGSVLSTAALIYNIAL